LGDIRECPSQNTFYSLKRNFPFHWLFLDLLLRESDLERERELEFKEREKKPWCTEVWLHPRSIGSPV
jgi:hypothetical protein